MPPDGHHDPRDYLDGPGLSEDMLMGSITNMHLIGTLLSAETTSPSKF